MTWTQRLKHGVGDELARRRTGPKTVQEVFAGVAQPQEPMSLIAGLATQRLENGFAKPWHYFEFYDRVLGDLARRSRNGATAEPVRLLEIGVWQGGSLDLWRQCFGESAVIFGVDIDEKCSGLPVRSAQIRIGSQADPQFLQDVVLEMGGVDVVIDDGSHVSAHVLTSLRTLFPLLADGGLYIIEDLVTSYMPEYGGGLRRRGSSIELLKMLVDHVNQVSFRKPAIDAEDQRIFADLAGIEFASSLACLRKQAPAPFELFINRGGAAT